MKNKIIKKIYLFNIFTSFCLIILASNNLYAQQLHHQMISSQGTSITTASGLIVKQTVGQQSVSGNSQATIGSAKELNIPTIETPNRRWNHCSIGLKWYL